METARWDKTGLAVSLFIGAFWKKESKAEACFCLGNFGHLVKGGT